MSYDARARLSDAGPRMEAAIRTLTYLGYTYHGGEQWKPPLGTLDDYNRGYARGHKAGTLQLLAGLRDLMTLWSGIHPAKLSIESILTESQR
jgi:hypothetical protein